MKWGPIKLMRLQRWASLCLALTLGSATLYAAPAQLERPVDPGPFAAGRSQFSLGGGSGSMGEDTYIVLQGRYGYFLTAGLAAQLGLETWLPLSGGQSLTTLAPGLSYYLYHTRPFVPYLGGFYQHSFTRLELESQDAYGGRAGALWQSSGLLLGLGARLTRSFGCTGGGCQLIEPELTVLLSF